MEHDSPEYPGAPTDLETIRAMLKRAGIYEDVTEEAGARGGRAILLPLDHLAMAVALVFDSDGALTATHGV